MNSAILFMVTTVIIATGASQGIGIKDITWTLGPNLPEYRKGGCGAALGGKVISVFGMRQPWGEMDTMYIFDPQTLRWRSRSPLPYRLSGMDCCAYQDRCIIVVGGAAEVASPPP